MCFVCVHELIGNFGRKVGDGGGKEPNRARSVQSVSQFYHIPRRHTGDGGGKEFFTPEMINDSIKTISYK